MSGTEPSGPGARGLDAARLKPVSEDPYEWADTDEQRTQAAAIDRLAGDQDLINQLRVNGFTGTDWQRTAEELVRYGLSTLVSWQLRGTIFDKCAARG
jgi:hypothetical protein